MATFRQRVDAICAPLPGAEASDPAQGDLDSWKVGGKMFATFGDKIDGVAVKTPSTENAAMLIDAGVGSKAPYFHRSWIRLPSTCPQDELRHRLHVSYDTIRSGLPRKTQTALAPREEA